MPKPDSEKIVSVRMPMRLYRQIERAAEKERRNVSNFIQVCVERQMGLMDRADQAIKDAEAKLKIALARLDELESDQG